MGQPTRFDNMKFPKYSYQEFPKWVKCKDGVDRIVNDAMEEAEATGKRFTPPVPEPSKFAHLMEPAPASIDNLVPGDGQPVALPAVSLPDVELSENEVLADLKVQCESLGITVKGTWGEKRMREAIADHMARN